MKKNVKQIIALILVLASCLALAACGSSSSQPAPGAAAPADSKAASSSEQAAQPAGEKYIKFVMALNQDPGNYLPFNADNSLRGQIQIFFYENLFDLFGTDQMTPTVASGYERVSEGVYHVSIRDNVYDHNGEHITADDVVYCFQTSIDINERASSLGEISSVKALDEYTVEFIFEPDLLGSFERAVTSTPIVSRKSYEASATGFSSDPVGTGPYYIDEWLPSSYITLKKDPNYWGKDEGFNNQNCDEIQIKFIAEPAQQAIELETGNIDFAYNISTKDADSFVDRPGFTVLNVPNPQMRGIGFNQSPDNVFSDIRLRQAVCYAIDAEGILNAVFDGKGGVCTSLAVPEPEAGLIIDYDQAWRNLNPYPHDVEKAKQLMAEAGYPDGGLKVRFLTNDNANWNLIAQIVQANCAEVGIEVEILSVENALYQTYRYQANEFDFEHIGISNNGVPYVPVGWKWYVGKHADTGANVFFQNDEHMEELINAALDIDTHSNETVGALQNYILDTATMYPMFYMNTPYVFVDTISDITFRDVFFYANKCTFSDDFVSHE